MLKAFCDRCKEEIPDWDEEEIRMNIVNGYGAIMDSFDLCEICGPKVWDTIRDFVLGVPK